MIEALHDQIRDLTLAQKVELLEWLTEEVVKTDKANHIVGGEYDMWLPGDIANSTDHHPDKPLTQN